MIAFVTLAGCGSVFEKRYLSTYGAVAGALMKSARQRQSLTIRFHQYITNQLIN